LVTMQRCLWTLISLNAFTTKSCMVERDGYAIYVDVVYECLLEYCHNCFTLKVNNWSVWVRTPTPVNIINAVFVSTELISWEWLTKFDLSCIICNENVIYYYWNWP
jgi:hypothetical protein